MNQLRRRQAYLATLLLCLFAGSSIASAALLQSGDEYEQGVDTTLADDVYLGARVITMRGTTNGDLYAAGSSIEVFGTVSEDALLMGGTVLVTGPVMGDARLIGGEVYLGGTVAEDAVIVGGTVGLQKDSVVERDLVVVADRFILDGTVKGNLKVFARVVEINGKVEGQATLSVRESLAVKGGAHIGGDLNYRAPRAAFITDDSSVVGKVNFERREMSGPSTTETSVVSFIIRVLVTLVSALLLLFLAPRFCAYATRTAFARSGTVLVWGFVSLILVPIVAVLSMVIVFGLLPGIFLLGSYAASVAVAKTLTPIFAGALLASWLKKDDALTYTWTVLGAVVLVAITYVPLLGWFMNTVLLLLGFGAIIVGLYEHVWPLQKLPVTPQHHDQEIKQPNSDNQSSETEKENAA